MENKDFEIRSIEIRAAEEDRVIEGTAIVFNSLSEDLGGFVEEILPEACSTEFLNNQDIVMLYNHETDAGVLARSKKGKGTLTYTIDEKGVNFRFKAKNTALGNEVYESVKAGDLDACSFAFRVAEGGEKWQNLGNGLYKRTISKFEVIRDFSIVVNPAYTQTSADTKDSAKRSLEAFKEEEQRLLEEAKEADRLKQEQEEEQRKLELNNYYQVYETLIQSLN